MFLVNIWGIWHIRSQFLGDRLLSGRNIDVSKKNSPKQHFDEKITKFWKKCFFHLWVLGCFRWLNFCPKLLNFSNLSWMINICEILGIYKPHKNLWMNKKNIREYYLYLSAEMDIKFKFLLGMTRWIHFLEKLQNLDLDKSFKCFSP